MTQPTGPMLVALLSFFGWPAGAAGPDSGPIAVDSPDGRIRVASRLDEAGRPGFAASCRGKVVAEARLGLDFAGSGPLGPGLEVVGTARSSVDRTYPIPVGKASEARDRGQPGLDFIAEVPTTWDETRVLVAEFGRCLVIARRKGSSWYLGGMTATESRDLALPLDFLGDGRRYVADLYLDDPARGPNAIARSERELTPADTLKVAIPRAGGFAGRLVPPTSR